MKKFNLLNIIVIILVLGLVTLGVLRFSGLVQNDEKTIDVSETATITKPADRVLINIGVETQGETATEAEDENTQITNSIYDALEELGLDEDGYSTEYFSVYPNKDWQNNGEIIDYTVSHNIKIDTEDLNLVGEILDRSISAGANQIYGLQFTLKDETEKSAKEEAYKKASEGARIKAESIAQGLGVKITKIISITDSSVEYYPLMRSISYDEAASSNSIQIESGDVTVTARISVSYGFK